MGSFGIGGQQMKTAVIGVGALGASILAKLMNDGIEIEGWSRSGPRKTSLDATVSRSEILISTLSGALTLCQVLDDLDIRGKTIISFSSATRVQTQELNEWVTARGALLIDAKFYGVPAMLGTDYATIFFSGHCTLAVRRLLTVLAPKKIYDLGLSVGQAATLDAAVLAVFYGAMTGFAQGKALCSSAGAASGAVFEKVLLGIFEPHFLSYLSSTIDDRGHLAEGSQQETSNKVHRSALKMLQKFTAELQMDPKLFQESSN